MGGRGGMGMQRGGIEGDKWQRGLQPPPPPGMQGGAQGGRGMGGANFVPTAKLHKSTSRYIVRPCIGPFSTSNSWQAAHEGTGCHTWCLFLRCYLHV